jgi:hypothetical protein
MYQNNGFIIFITIFKWDHNWFGGNRDIPLSLASLGHPLAVVQVGSLVAEAPLCSRTPGYRHPSGSSHVHAHWLLLFYKPVSETNKISLLMVS